METPGARLKKIRLEKGITLDEVHRGTKIHLNILKAIEGDGFTNLSPVYLKGFLKIYCNFLGVDQQGYTSEHKNLGTQIKKEDSAVNQISKAEPKKEKKAEHAVKAEPLNLNIIRSSEGMKTAFKIGVISIIILIGLFKIGQWVSNKQAAPVDNKTDIPKQSTPSKPKAVGSVKQISSGIKLGARANQNCWMSVKVDGRVVFQRVLEKGRYESWQADKIIELSLGNAGGVELEVNGELFTNLGRRGQVLKNIIITEEGLKVDK